ncbi:hypothetical protein ACTHQY_14975 [Rhodococcoides corynebacterioides]|uniref:hypothetical protein n=1 Tax=Rhodococcoides corynebacterioides TaxID=53972 RepID=UPI003F7EF27F
MPGIPMTFQKGQRTFTPVEAILGGQLVEGRTGGIGVAAAGSVRVVGVAIADAQPPSALVTTPQTVNGRSVLDAAPLATSVTVVSAGTEVPVKYSANAAFGDKLVATAGGTVAPAGATPDARTIVGKCTEPGGVAFATNPVGLMQTV